MKVSNFTFNLTSMDLLAMIKKFIDPDDKIKKIETDENGIYIFLPTPFNFEIKLSIEVSCVSGFYLCLEMHVANLGLLPNKIKDKAIEKFFPAIEAVGIKHTKNEILIDLRQVFAEGDVKLEIEKIETSQEGVKVTGKNLHYPLPGLK